MSHKGDDLSSQMLALRFPDGTTASAASTTATSSGSWAGRPARQRPALTLGASSIGGSMGKADKRARRPPGMLFFPESPTPSMNSCSSDPRHDSSSSLEQERKMKEIMNQTGKLQLESGEKVLCAIDDLELVGDLGNGTCGHVVKMLHKPTGTVMAVKQMRRTGNNDENKRIIMDLDVVLKSHDCEHIVLCLGCFVTDSDVWICMELMSTCFDKLLKQLKQPIPEAICGKVAVSTLKALNYLKVRHDVIHRDVKPSNILLDQSGRVKLCDFGISGRLVDSKARTRSAGCAAYMAPERIDPPLPSKPEYDIRADVWSLGITLVELATGHFPYRDCKTDFEVLTKVLQDDPPLLPRNGGFSNEFSAFVRDCLMKDYNHRPKYKKLLGHAFIQRYEKEEVDVGAWYRSHMKNLEQGTSPNNNTAASSLANNAAATVLTSSPAANAETPAFKPQPSPRIARNTWRTTCGGNNYPSAIERKNSQTAGSEEQRSYFSRNQKSSLSSSPEKKLQQPQKNRSPPSPPRSRFVSTGSDQPYSSAYVSRYDNYPFKPTTQYSGNSTPTSSSSTTTTPYHQPSAYLSHHSTSGPSSYQGYYSTASPRSSRKPFDFTFPSGANSTSTTSPYFMQDSSSHLYHQFRSGDTRLHHQYRQHHHHQQQKQQQPQPRSLDSVEQQYYQRYYPQGYREYQYRSELDRPARPRTALTARSPSQERPSVSTATSTASMTASTTTTPSRSSYLSNWRNWNWVQSPLSLRRRTASSDRSSAAATSPSAVVAGSTSGYPFDVSRRFQPSYRSWNERDGSYRHYNTSGAGGTSTSSADKR